MHHRRGVGYQKATEVEDSGENKGEKDHKTIFFNYVLIAFNRLYADFRKNLKKIRMHC